MTGCAREIEPGMRCPYCGSQAIAMIHRCGTGGRCRYECIACECDSLGSVGPSDRSRAVQV